MIYTAKIEQTIVSPKRREYAEDIIRDFFCSKEKYHADHKRS